MTTEDSDEALQKRERRMKEKERKGKRERRSKKKKAKDFTRRRKRNFLKVKGRWSLRACVRARETKICRIVCVATAMTYVLRH